MENVGKKPSTDQLATEHVCTEDVGTQLVNIESIQRTIMKQVSSLEHENSRMDMVISEIKSVLPKIDSLQASLRKAFNTHTRPLIRDLHVFHLPEEVLGMISQHVKGGINKVGRNFITDDIQSIKSMRLTCWRFSDAASPLLLTQLQVSLTTSSLAHLDAVSRHPTISKGIRSLKVRFGLYDPTELTDLHSFVVIVEGILLCDLKDHDDCIRTHLQLRVREARRGSSYNGYGFSLLEEARLFEKCVDVLRSCTTYLTSSEPRDDENIMSLRQAFQKYRQLVVDQEMLLRDDVFTRDVTAAAGRMRTITKLFISDNEDGKFPPLAELQSDPIYNHVRRALPTPSRWVPAVLNKLQHRPFKLLYQVPLKLSQAVNSLTELSMDIPVATDIRLRLREEHIKDFAKVTEQLEELSINGRWITPADGSKHSPGQWAIVPELASLPVNVSNLRRVSLNFRSFKSAEGWEGVSVGPLLALLPWTNLRVVDLIGIPIHFEELRTLLQMLQPGNFVFLQDVYLQSGIWADLLDVLRGKFGTSSGALDPAGKEDEESDPDWHARFGGGHTQNLIDDYLDGRFSQNPLRRLPNQGNTYQEVMYEIVASKDDSDSDES